MRTDFEQRLRTELARSTVLLEVPPGLAHKADRRNRRRRTTARALAAAGAAGVTAAAVAAALTANSGTTPRQPPSTAYVVSHITKALDALATTNPILYEYNGQSQFWIRVNGDVTQDRQQELTSSGRPATDTGYSHPRPGTDITVFVDYHTKTWWRKTDIMLPNPHPSMTPNPGGSTSPVCDPGLDITNSPQTTVASIRTAMSCGNMRIIGTQRINGVDAIKLAGAIKAGPRPHDQGSLTLWVNPATYLPLRTQWILPGTPDDVENFQWLPPTPANLARLTVPIPAGFTQVAPPQKP